MQEQSGAKLFNEGVMAWAADIAALHSTTPLPQTEIIPIACAWAAVSHVKSPEKPLYPAVFTQDLLANAQAVEVLDLLMKDEPWWRMPANSKVALDQFNSRDYAHPPHSFFATAINLGRDSAQRSVNAREVAVASVLGSAAYNSTSGGWMLSLDPLGPHELQPELWKTLGFDNTVKFVEALTA